MKGGSRHPCWMIDLYRSVFAENITVAFWSWMIWNLDEWEFVLLFKILFQHILGFVSCDVADNYHLHQNQRFNLPWKTRVLTKQPTSVVHRFPRPIDCWWRRAFGWAQRVPRMARRSLVCCCPGGVWDFWSIIPRYRIRGNRNYMVIVSPARVVGRPLPKWPIWMGTNYYILTWMAIQGNYTDLKIHGNLRFSGTLEIRRFAAETLQIIILPGFYMLRFGGVPLPRRCFQICLIFTPTWGDSQFD